MLPEIVKQQLELVKQLIDQGMVPEALKMESDIRNKNPRIKIPSVPCELELNKFITVDESLLLMKDTIRLLALENDPVLLYGETGVGKEIIARALHGSRNGKFVGINCTSLPDYLLESELFGHKKGSFTGADSDKVGLLQYAWNGTIFLDEIGDMPLALQAKLLRAFQEMVIRRVGATETIAINCRIVSATNKNLQDMLDKSNGSSFRRDLFYRLSTFEIFIKPLRDRVEDIYLIAESLGMNREIANTKLLEYISTGFRGNVRQLQAAIRRWKVLG